MGKLHTNKMQDVLVLSLVFSDSLSSQALRLKHIGCTVTNNWVSPGLTGPLSDIWSFQIGHAKCCKWILLPNGASLIFINEKLEPEQRDWSASPDLCFIHEVLSFSTIFFSVSRDCILFFKISVWLLAYYPECICLEHCYWILMFLNFLKMQ